MLEKEELSPEMLEKVIGGAGEPKTRRMIVGTDENGNPIYVEIMEP